MLSAKRIYEKRERPAAYYNASICNNLGLLYQDMGRIEEAASLHERSLSILETGVASRVEYAVTLNNLWPAYVKLGKIREAEEYMEKALEILGEEVGEEHPVYSASLNNLATYVMRKGDYARALEMFRRSSEIAEKTLGKESNNYIKLQQHIALAEQKLREAGQA